MEFIKNFFRDNTSESSARLVLIMSAVNVNLMCAATLLIFYVTDGELDFSSQCALLSGILLGFAGTFKAFQKGKENPNNLKENL